MARLPFIVEPKAKPIKIKIGSEEVGIFEIERRGYLSVAEKSFVESFTSSSGSLREIVKISNKISTTSKVSREQAYKSLMNVMSGVVESKLEKDVASKYADEIAELTALMADVQSKRMLAVSTILLQSRVDPEWTLDDTLELDEQTLEQLNNLYDQEEAKVRPEEPTEDLDSEEQVKELLGK